MSAKYINYDVLFKVIMIGDTCVGKTSLLVKYIDNIFNENTISTIGVDLKSMYIINHNDNIVKLQIWDTAGQERFRTITNLYYKGTHAVILVFDLSVRSSFDNLNFWINHVNTHCDSNISLVIVGNKSDIDRKVSKEEITSFMEKNNKLNVSYVETSAKDNKSIENIFKLLVHDLTENKKLMEQVNNDIIRHKLVIDKNNPKCCIML